MSPPNLRIVYTPDSIPLLQQWPIDPSSDFFDAGPGGIQPSASEARYRVETNEGPYRQSYKEAAEDGSITDYLDLFPSPARHRRLNFLPTPPATPGESSTTCNGQSPQRQEFTPPQSSRSGSPEYDAETTDEEEEPRPIIINACRRTPYYPPNSSRSYDKTRVYMPRGPHYKANWTPISSLSRSTQLELEERMIRSMIRALKRLNES